MLSATASPPLVLADTPTRARPWRSRVGAPLRGGAAERLVGLAVALVGSWPVLRYLWVVAHRLGYPFELEWLEGGAVELAHRVATAQALYGPPSLHFTPWPYPPLYFWISGALARVIGVGFLPLRIVSTAASLVVLWLLYRLVVAETGDRAGGVLAAGVYAATYRLAGAWADLGRVDSLFLAFALAGLVVAHRAQSRRAGAVAGLLFFLSFFTKQDGLLIALPVVAWLLIVRRRAGVSALAVLGGLVALSTVALDAVSHGWYRYYVFGELPSQGIVRSQWQGFWRHDLWYPLGLVVGLIVIGLALLFLGRRFAGHRSEGEWPVVGWRAGGFCAAGALGLLGAAWAGRLHAGGYDNVLMPGYAAVAWLVGLVVARLRSHPTAVARLGLSAGVVVIMGAQFHRTAYPIGPQIPSAADQRSGDAFLTLVRHLPGRVVVLDHPFYATLAGKGTNADEEAANDIERSGPSSARRVLVADMRTALLRPGVGAVILDNTGDERNLRAELRSGYRLLATPAVAGNAFSPVTDLQLRPSLVFVRRTAAASGTGR